MQENRQEKSLIKQKILLYLTKKGISTYKFYKDSGITRGVLSQNNGITEDNLARFLAYAPDVNADWLLTGHGEMLKPNVPDGATPSGSDSHEPSTSSDKDTKNIPNNQEKAIPFFMADQQNLKPIPLVTQTVAAGFGNENFAIADSDVKEFYVIPKFRYCNIDFMIEVSGDSMTPHLNSGDVIACSIIKDSHFIQWNRIHVIATREQGLLVKRLAPSSDDGCLQAVSDNPKYPPFSIPKDEINGLALVVGSVCLE